MLPLHVGTEAESAALLACIRFRVPSPFDVMLFHWWWDWPGEAACYMLPPTLTVPLYKAKVVVEWVPKWIRLLSVSSDVIEAWATHFLCLIWARTDWLCGKLAVSWPLEARQADTSQLWPIAKWKGEGESGSKVPSSIAANNTCLSRHTNYTLVLSSTAADGQEHTRTLTEPQNCYSPSDGGRANANANAIRADASATSLMRLPVINNKKSNAGKGPVPTALWFDDAFWHSFTTHSRRHIRLMSTMSTWGMRGMVKGKNASIPSK